MQYVAGVMYCSACFSRNFFVCSSCGVIDKKPEAQKDDGEEICQSCFNEKYVVHGYIHSHDYKPVPTFFGTGNRYYGIELEIDCGGENPVNAGKVSYVAKHNATESDERIYCKRDGSLGDGFEIVTHPMSIDYHCSNMPWDKVLRAAREMGYTSHQAGTCGLHVHVSRKALGETDEGRSAVIARILYFIEIHWGEILVFSRRTASQLRQWAKRYGCHREPSEVLEYAYAAQDRYSCVNLANDNTIEFRMFRGTLVLNTLLATLQLVHSICDFAILSSDEMVKNTPWSSFVSSISPEAMPELVQYLKERRLYVSEPITSGADI